MKEKTQRNENIYSAWRKGVEKYLETGLQKDLVSYYQLGRDYNIKPPVVRKIVLRLHNKQKGRDK